ncbi:hypothetical protein B296_00022387 [Ensete ventricosum]|uniref:Tyrosine-protein kinase catalytic domain-containing protein n=1 Tax=Ensete ventricosum TaxID=4639 RepID=A0A427AEV5_ENSVE|nr:hypothetical protein B296_00022387 [Ensete ventricosum]
MLTLRVGAEMVECLLLRAGLQARVSKWPRNARRVSQGSAAPRFPSSGRMRSPVTTIGGRSPVDGARRSRDIWDVSRSSASSGSSAGGSSSSSSSGRNPMRIAARAITSCFGSHDGGLPPSADDSEDLKPPSPQLDDGTVVAVKRAKKVFGNTHNSHLNAEFQNEIQTLARIEHLSLVRLHGYLEHQDERIVIVEYVSNGTLREHLDCKFLMLNFPLWSARTNSGSCCTAMKRFTEGNGIQTLDPNIKPSLATNLAVEKILELALLCLAPTKKSRPSMRRCAEILWTIRKDYREFLSSHPLAKATHHIN